MSFFDIEGTGIFNSQISHSNTKISQIRKTNIFEFELPIENGGISHINAESAKITPNLLICAKPEQSRHTKFPFKCYYIHINIYDNEMLNTARSLPNFVNLKNSDEYVRLFKNIIKYNNSNRRCDKYMVQSEFLRLFFLLCKESEATNAKSNNNFYNSQIETAIEYINENLTEKITLESVAYAVSLSPTYFHSIFKKAIGQTLHDYIENKRIKKSIHLMETTDMTLTEIAYSCGFSSQSYFSYSFKRRMKTTPRKYIQALNNNYEI